MCINTHCTPIKFSKYYPTTNGKAGGQTTKKVKEPQRVPDFSGWYYHHIYKGNPDSYYWVKKTAEKPSYIVIK